MSVPSFVCCLLPRNSLSCRDNLLKLDTYFLLLHAMNKSQRARSQQYYIFSIKLLVPVKIVQ